MSINERVKKLFGSKSGEAADVSADNQGGNTEDEVRFESIEEKTEEPEGVTLEEAEEPEEVAQEEEAEEPEEVAQEEEAEEPEETVQEEAEEPEETVQEEEAEEPEETVRTKSHVRRRSAKKKKPGEETTANDTPARKRRRRRGRREKDMAKVKKKRKAAAITIGVIIGLAVAAYAGFAFFFMTHFFYNTSLNGMDVSLKNAEEVKSYMENKVENYQLVIEESGDKEEVIKGTDIDINYVPGKEIERVLAGQSVSKWITSLWEKSEIETQIGVAYDNDKLEKQISALQCLVPDTQVASQNAYPQFRGTAFIVVPEKIGTQIDAEKLGGEIRKAIDGFQDEMSILDTGCYLLPAYTKNSSEVTAARDEMNSYLGAEITYDFSPYTEVVGAAQIAEWVKVDENMKVTFNEGAVRGYVASLATKYDTLGKNKQFTTASGNVVTVEGGDYGWEIDQNAEYSALTANISGKEVVTREPHYLSRAASHDVMDMGNTYVEVDLTNQYLYFFQDGAIALECPVVTGNPNAGNGTPQGAYWLSYKESPSVLRAPLRPDGTREYETPVSFWMPFNGGIGLHDATWQPAFGGDRYLYAGSHGCVNMSYDTAARLYELIPEYCPVICHY